MGTILSHRTALAALRRCTSGVLRCSVRPQVGRPNVARAHAFLGPQSDPMHLLVFSKGSRTHAADAVSHVSRSLPPRLLTPLGDGLYTASPELCFVQLAEEIPFLSLIELGFELCGHYALAPAEQRGFASRRVPLTSAAQLRRAADALAGAHGAKAARKAARFVMDGAASPMETALAMLLCLPSAWGGKGIERPTLNGSVPLPPSQRSAPEVAQLHCDLLWARQGVAVEYDSDAFHVGAERIGRDARRRATLARAGVAVITVTREQVMSRHLFDETAQAICRALGKRLRVRAADHDLACTALRLSLFARDRFVP